MNDIDKIFVQPTVYNKKYIILAIIGMSSHLSQSFRSFHPTKTTNYIAVQLFPFEVSVYVSHYVKGVEEMYLFYINSKLKNYTDLCLVQVYAPGCSLLVFQCKKMEYILLFCKCFY